MNDDYRGLYTRTQLELARANQEKEELRELRHKAEQTVAAIQYELNSVQAELRALKKSSQALVEEAAGLRQDLSKVDEAAKLGLRIMELSKKPYGWLEDVTQEVISIKFKERHDDPPA